MRIALIADIHANLQAFAAVTADAGSRKAEMIWNAGDFLGYGPNPEEVVQWNKKACILSILGNYDHKVLKLRQTGELKTKSSLKRFAFQWTLDQLSKDSRQYLRSLPESIRIQYAGWKILLVHGSPSSREEPLTTDTTEERLIELEQAAQVDIILCGHSHVPFSRKVNNTWFINPGSVGRQDDGDYRASYALLELAPESLQVTHRRLDYNIKATLDEMERKDLPEAFRLMFHEGKNLDTILKQQKE